MISKLWAKLRDHGYRKAFVASQINIGIPFQIRALLKARGWTQEKLAERTGMLQPRISAMLKPGKTRPNIETLRRIAEAFDCGLMVRFVPFSELAHWSERFEPDSFNVASFAEDSGFIDRKTVERAAYSSASGILIADQSCYSRGLSFSYIDESGGPIRLQNAPSTNDRPSDLGAHRQLQPVHILEERISNAR